MPSKEYKILEFNQYKKSDKIPSIGSRIFIEKVDGCKNNPEKSATPKSRLTHSLRYPMSAIWTFDGIESKHDVCRGEDCMKTVL